MKANKTTMHEISLSLDERNLAHVFSALALAAIADTDVKTPCEAARCWWTEDAFCLRLPKTQEDLFNDAHQFVKSINWTGGIGCDEKRKIKASPHHGFFSANGGHCGNPLVCYHDQGATPSVFKTFSGQKGPADILEKQKNALIQPATAKPDWISQRARGVASWKFDARTGGHAYSQGFSANDDGSGAQSPFYPAIELLSIAGAAFLFAPQALLRDEETLCYFVWRTELLLPLAPLAAARILDGLAGRTYCLSTSGNAYGKGAAYRHFTEATPL